MCITFIDTNNILEEIKCVLYCKKISEKLKEKICKLVRKQLK